MSSRASAPDLVYDLTKAVFEHSHTQFSGNNLKTSINCMMSSMPILVLPIAPTMHT